MELVGTCHLGIFVFIGEPFFLDSGHVHHVCRFNRTEESSVSVTLPPCLFRSATISCGILSKLEFAKMSSQPNRVKAWLSECTVRPYRKSPAGTTCRQAVRALVEW